MNSDTAVEARQIFHVFNCATHGDVQILQNFLEHEQLDINQRDAHGKTALYLASEYNQEVAVTTLIKAGADMEMVPFGECLSRTPVMIAAEFGYTGCLRALTTAGADINVMSPSGETPLKVALKKGNLQCGKILLSAGANISEDTMTYINNALFEAVYYEDTALVEILLHAGANPNCRDRGGRTVLMYAVGTKSTEICQLLLIHKADVNAKDMRDKTAVMYAGSKQTMEVLLNNGADLEIKNYRGYTPLVHFLLYKSPNILMDIENVNALLEHGANPVVDTRYRSIFCYGSQIRKYPEYQEYPFHNFTLESAIAYRRRELIRLNVCNGVVPDRLPSSTYGLASYTSPIGCALHFQHDDVVKYFLANCYLTDVDIKNIHQVLRRKALCLPPTDVASMSNEMETLLHKAMCEPWPLVKLAFITVSSALGTSPEREQRVAKTCLPDRIKRMLMFQEPIARLPVREWSSIPLYFDSVEYEAQPRPRPLLYYWPYGRTLVG